MFHFYYVIANAPSFTNPGTLTMSDSSAIGYTVHTLVASDSDTQDTLTLSMTSSSNYFSFTPGTGKGSYQDLLLRSIYFFKHAYFKVKIVASEPVFKK